MEMLIRDCIEGVDVLETRGPLDRDAAGVTIDSRRVEEGFLFAAIGGMRLKGADFRGEAAGRGAACIVSDAPFLDGYPGATWVRVRDARAALSRIAANYHGHPARAMRMTGITGTAGKTTTSYIVHSILRAAGARAGLIGTIEVRLDGRREKSALTTPDAADLHALLARMRGEGAGAVVMEVSSHALALRRVDDVAFDVAVFTNLGHDHLDFHRDLEEYAATKALLFGRLLKAGGGCGAVVNGDDPRAGQMTAGYAGTVLRFSMRPGRGADIAPRRFRATLGGIEAELDTPAGPLAVSSTMLGAHNLLNCMAAAGAAILSGVATPAIEEGIRGCGAVPGRMERIDGAGGRMAIVDYSHKPEALAAVIDALAALGRRGRIVTVIGAGGDREKEKRPLMARAACERSDAVIITSDNPRTEDPLAIIAMLVEGAEAAGARRTEGELARGTYRVVPDRGEAIELAIAGSREGDIVLVAGKGHEEYQVLGDRTVRFSDREQVVGALRRHGLMN